MQQLVVYDEQLLAGEALAAALQHLAHRVVTVGCVTALGDVLAPEPSLLVLNLRGRTAFEDERAVRLARSACAVARIVCLTRPDRASLHRSLKRAGAQSVVHRDRPWVIVLSAVTGSDPGADTIQDHDWMRTRLQFLTRQERTTFELMSVALTTREISTAMGISHSTARCYAQAVLQKLGAHTRLEAMAVAGRERCG